jgi:hypothetical protein
LNWNRLVISLKFLKVDLIKIHVSCISYLLRPGAKW